MSDKPNAPRVWQAWQIMDDLQTGETIGADDSFVEKSAFDEERAVVMALDESLTAADDEIDGYRAALERIANAAATNAEMLRQIAREALK